MVEQEVRVVTNEDVKKYDRLVTKYLRDNVAKNWNEATLSVSQDEVGLGNTGMTMSDMRQHLMTEVVVALQKYNPNYRTKPRYQKNEDGTETLDDAGNTIMVDPGGRSVKESTFVYQHLFNRCGQLMKRLTKKRYGYGVWSSELSTVLHENEVKDS